MLPLLLTLLVAAAPATAPESPSASLKKSQAFQEWRGGRFVLEERWAELPQAGLHVGYFLVPKYWKAEGDEVAFDDAFFVVDRRTGQPVAPALVRTKVPRNGCPAAGEVTQLSPEPESATSAALRFGNGPQRCLLRLRRVKDAWTLSLFPDEARSVEETFPEAALALAKVLGAGDAGAGALQWAYLPNSRWLLAAPREECALWVIDSLTQEVNATASKAMTGKICQCIEDAVGDTDKSFGLEQVAYSLSRMGEGTSLPTCDCTFAKTGEADVSCDAYAGRTHSVGILAQMEEDGSLAKEQAAEALKEIADERRTYDGLLAANQNALELWRTDRPKEALTAWAGLYRTWIHQGRPAPVNEELVNIHALSEEEAAVLQEQMNTVRQASIDLWAEILNNLGFALWSRKEWSQAEAVLTECMDLLMRTNRERNVLHLNRGDLYRDMGKLPEAMEAYQRFLSGKVTAAQRKYAERELRKLEKRSK
ncbi:tetratricopeptide repeat protein [Pyxidicoccus fallax]|uniref:Tetratricopeptide repeat protein n=1 Tax=Pyxidicoccus fallax TaxID=394095 RepID=A0A848LI16_9BACT|nr:tetratricopeptide repeat protein [Pyxidicoccus fallax]NMO17048.1 tetratricopeptide repeat protein [Pyxidicoccus fallax]NPC83341.1 tetratricopeptide repeat protein [Pyxidicoccus fallax]